MHLLLLSPESPLSPASGTGRYVRTLAAGLARQGVRVVILAPGDAASTAAQPEGWTLRQFISRAHFLSEPHQQHPEQHPAFPFNCLDANSALSWQFADEVAAYVKECGAPDVIESQETDAPAYYLQQRQLLDNKYLCNTPICVHLHGPHFLRNHSNQLPSYKFPRYWTSRMEMACILAADQLIAPSQFIMGEVRAALEAPDLPIHQVPLPVALPQLPAATRERGKVVFLGRFEPGKGILELLSSCERLWQDGLQFTLDMAGSDTLFAARGVSMTDFLRHKYRARIDQGLLRIHGPLPREQALSLCAGADFSVVPSIWENFPYTAVEAMAMGKVVLASTSGGQAELVGDSDSRGLRFDWNILGDFERQFRKALSLSDAEASAIGASAAQYVNHLCDPVAVIARRIELYRQLIASKTPRKYFPFTNPHARSSSPAIPQIPHTSGLLSAVIPFYNLGDTIEETVASIAANSYRPLEILIVDDGSADPKSLAALESLKSRYPSTPDFSLRVLRQHNQGLAQSRNNGAAAAHGEFLLLCDADDTVAPDYAEKAIAVLRRWENVHLVYSWEKYFGESTDIWPNSNLEFPYLLAHNLCPSRPILRRASFLAFGQNKARALPYNFEDWDGWLSMLEAGCGGVSLPDILVRYRIRSGSQWQTSTRDQHLWLYEQLARLHPDLYKRYGIELFHLQNANGPAQSWNRPCGNSPYEDRENYFNYLLAEKERQLAALQSQLAHLRANQPSS